ncbi:hypothetical protein L5G28_16360 [Gordonia sp. HY285]|uniref:hypothetical protein n=1 Tax=Gordonia liuliyuniae TaxID=2911517 RepID=UPI001F1F5705|nr:hypothetical protein [Gordonia liuliyuniae]MCF8611720.1 hypothetical protein [Gordonia liuliyuniae]
MSSFTLTISTDGAAFDGSGHDWMIGTIAQALADVALSGVGLVPGLVHDINGNRCGTIEISTDDWTNEPIGR